VIHRDIKPDNLVIRNIRLDDEAILVGGLEHLPWAALRERWHLTLIDFGFARALGPEDLEAEASLKTLIGATHSSKTKKKNNNKATTHLEEQESIDGAINDASRYFSRNEQLLNDDSSKSGRKGRMNDDSSKSRRKGRMNDDSSKSRRIVRCLSAIGNRTYSAPEVKNKVRRIETIDASRRTREINASTLVSFVSDYGLVADAFSVGCTARFLLTGIPAHENVNEFMGNHNNLFNKAARWIGRKVAKRRNVSKTVKKYRPSEDIPIEAVRLIKGMTQPNASLRMTVRGVRLDPYVNDAVGEKTTFRKEMVYLNCAQK
jgi:serine/threonine protein kinase